MINWRISPLVKKICALSSLRNGFSWHWVPRKANEAANHVASLSVRKTCPKVWATSPPSSLVHILSRDGLPCPPLDPPRFAPVGA
jgi:hypothetical protein